jgi:cytochrome c oxidase assembly factor CtaG
MRAARAHTLEPLAPSEIGWSFEPFVVIPLGLLALLYLCGHAELARRSRASLRRRALLFWTGYAALLLALVSPIHVLGTQVFAVHMIEHEILMVIAAPLLVASRPGPILLWGLPQAAREQIAAILRAPLLRGIWHAGTELWTATALHALVLWVWHAPALFHLTLESELAHIGQHASFLLSALLFWTAVLRHGAGAVGQGAAVMALFLTSLQAGMLGALMTLSRTPWYPFAPDPMSLSGLTRMDDQSLAGLIMWIPACSVYAGIALIVMHRWLSLLERQDA